MRVIAKATRAEAEALIAEEDAHRGLPRTETGIRVGGGRHAETITTIRSAEPVELDDGWGVLVEHVTKPAIDIRGAVDRASKESALGEKA